ncbi:MAG: hypothetical protein IJA75_05515 [Oscillospiraceae bacterium]|nr:hypothetical protein [Oscillospiraceae bacterium]
MDKNEFDVDFDFEKEFGLTPEDLMDPELDEDLDLSQFDFGEPEDAASEDGDDLADIESFLSGTFDDTDFSDELPAEEEDYAFPAEDSAEEDVLPDGDVDLDDTRIFFADRTPEPEAEEEAFSGSEDTFSDEPLTDDDPPVDDGGDDDGDGFDDDYDDEECDDEDEEESPRRSRREPREPSAVVLFLKAAFEKVKAAVLAFVIPPAEPEEAVDPNNPRRRRRKKSKLQRFKEGYLPTIIAGVALILIFTFIVGSISGAIQRGKDKQQQASMESQAAQQEQDRLDSEAQKIMAEAERLAAGYDYEGAIKLLDSFSGDQSKYQGMITQKAGYADLQSTMVEWSDPNQIPNLSFHVLIADPSRAWSDNTYGGQYNRNFVTTEEFSKILNQLYANNYVLVDFDSFTEKQTALDGAQVYMAESIYLPEGKKPVMITETMVNYFAYMIDSNSDGTPDAGGAGFASKLVLDANGDIKAQLVTTDNQTVVGDYDLVPILEAFIKEHPDFCYRGARATLAVTGHEGVFGYRCNTSYVQNFGNDFYEQECADAKKIVQALRDKGYTIACYSYNNENYRDLSAQQIKEDIQKWQTQTVPIVGEVDIIVFARATDIDDYSGAKFKVLKDAGFRVFVNSGNAPYAEINTDYIRQTRLMVTGNAMGWYSNRFATYFDCNLVLDSSRGSIPN